MKQMYLFLICFFLLILGLKAHEPDTLTARKQLEMALVQVDSSNYDKATNIGLEIVQNLKDPANETPDYLVKNTNTLFLFCDTYLLLGDCFNEKSDYEKAISYFQETLNVLGLLDQKKENEAINEFQFTKRVAQTYNYLGNWYLNFGQYQEALDYHQNALNIRQQIWGNFNEKVADSYNNIGNCLYSYGDYQQALFAHDNALNIRLQIFGKNHLDVATSYNNIGLCWMKLNNSNNALPYLEKALKIRQTQLGFQHPKTAQSLKNLGIYHFNNNNIEEAIDNYEKVLEIEKKFYGEQHARIGNTYNSIGNCYIAKKDVQKAMIYYDKAIAIQVSILGDEHPEVATTYSNIAHAFMEKKDYGQAQRFYIKAKNIREVVYQGQNHNDLALSYDDLGRCEALRENFDEAREWHGKALNILPDNHPFTGRVYSNLGNCYFYQKDYEKALSAYHQGNSIFEQSATNPLLVTSNTSNIGICYLKRQQYEAAINSFQNAIERHQLIFGKQHPGLAKDYRNLAEVYFQLGDFKTAQFYISTGIELLKKDNPVTHPSSTVILPNQSYWIDFLHLLSIEAKTAFALAKNGTDEDRISQLEQSDQSYDLALRMIDTLRLSYQVETSKQQLTQHTYHIFEGAIRTCLALWQLKKTDAPIHYLEKAFSIAEKSKSLILLEAFQKTQAQNHAGIPKELLEKEYQLRVDLGYFEKKRNEAAKNGSDSILMVMENHIFDLQEQYKRLIRQFEKDFEDYYRFKYDLETISLMEVQQKVLMDDQAMLNYFVGDSSIFIFLITKTDLQGFEIKRDFPIDAWTKKIRDGIYQFYFAGKDKIDQLNQDYLYYAHQLYQKLVEPVLSTTDLPERLVIIPDSELGYLPFDALIRKMPEQNHRFKSHQYLLKDFAISYSFSATLLAATIAKPSSKAKKEVLAFAPTFENNSRGLAHLEYTPTEAETILGLLDGHLFADTSATLNKFLEMASDYFILHLATHGKTDTKKKVSWLAFTEIPDSLDNELLYVNDLYSMRLNAAMVVLSACETGLGKFQRGEGAMSLARAFSYAGANSVLTTLWSINDKETAHLMELFYGYIKAGEPKDKALWMAKRDFIEAHDSHKDVHPYYWAAYVALGDMKPIKTGNSWWFWGILGISVLGVGIGLSKYSRLVGRSYFLKK